MHSLNCVLLEHYLSLPSAIKGYIYFYQVDICMWPHGHETLFLTISNCLHWRSQLAGYTRFCSLQKQRHHAHTALNYYEEYPARSGLQPKCSKTRECLTLLRYTCSSVKSIECKHPPTETPLHNVGRSDQRGNKADNIACPEPAATKLRSTAAAALMQVAPQRFLIDALCPLISIATSGVDHSHECLALFCTPLSQQAFQHGISNINCLYAAACAAKMQRHPKQYRK